MDGLIVSVLGLIATIVISELQTRELQAINSQLEAIGGQLGSIAALCGEIVVCFRETIGILRGRRYL